MSDDRIVSRRESGGARIRQLNDFEYRVWSQYRLSADDFGVMVASASVLRGDNPYLDGKPFKKVQQALERILAVGLIYPFVMQDLRYVWQLDWQDWQKIRYPRRTTEPKPIAAILNLASEATQKLFSLHPGGLTKHSGNDSGKFPPPAGAGAQETHTLTQTHTLSSGSGSSEGGVGETAVAHWTPPIGSLDRVHRQHAWCSPREGLCVPMFLHREFIGKLGGLPSADMELRAWYPAVVAKYEGVPVGDDALDFWRNEFREWVGTVTTKAHGGAESITAHTMREAREYLESKR